MTYPERAVFGKTHVKEPIKALLIRRTDKLLERRENCYIWYSGFSGTLPVALQALLDLRLKIIAGDGGIVQATQADQLSATLQRDIGIVNDDRVASLQLLLNQLLLPSGQAPVVAQ